MMTAASFFGAKRKQPAALSASVHVAPPVNDENAAPNASTAKSTAATAVEVVDAKSTGPTAAQLAQSTNPGTKFSGIGSSMPLYGAASRNERLWLSVVAREVLADRQLPIEEVCTPLSIRRLTPLGVRLVRPTDGPTTLQSVCTLSFDADGVLLAVGHASGLLSFYDWDEYTARSQQLNNALQPGSAMSVEVATSYQAVEPVHSLVCPGPVIAAVWHPHRSNDIAVVCHGVRDVLVYDLEQMPEKPSRILARDEAGVVGGDTNVAAGNTALCFVDELTAAPSRIASDGFDSFDRIDNGDEEIVDLSCSTSHQSSGTLVAAGDGRGCVRLWEPRAAVSKPGHAGSGSSGLRWTADVGEVLRLAAAASSMPISNNTVASSSASASTGLGKAKDITAASSASASSSVLGKRSSQEMTSTANISTAAAAAAGAMAALNASRPAAASVPPASQAPKPATVSAAVPSASSSSSAAPGPAIPTGLSSSQPKNGPSSTSLSYSPIAYYGASVRKEWRPDDLPIVKVWPDAQGRPILHCANAGGGVVGFDLRRMSRSNAGFSVRPSPSVVYAWDAQTHVSAAWMSTMWVETSAYGPSGMSWHSGSVSAWPCSLGGGTAAGQPSNPVTLQSVLFDPLNPGTVTAVFSNGWSSVHEGDTGRVISIHRPDVTKEEVDMDKQRYALPSSSSSASSGAVGASSNGAVGVNVAIANQAGYAIQGAPSKQKGQLPPLSRDRLRVVTMRDSCVYLPGRHRSSVLVTPQSRVLMPRPVARTNEIVRTHFRGSVGTRTDNIEDPFTSYALSFVSMSGHNAKLAAKYNRMLSSIGASGVSPASGSYATAGGGWAAPMVSSSSPQVYDCADHVMPTHARVSAVTTHAKRHDLVVCGMETGEIVALGMMLAGQRRA